MLTRRCILSALPHTKPRRPRLISVNSAKRHPSAQQVPTAAQAGLPGCAKEVAMWSGVVKRAGVSVDN